MQFHDDCEPMASQCVHASARTKLAEVRLERNARPVLAGLARLDGRLALDGHVGAEDLAVAPLPAAVARLDHELGREDVGQLGAVPVAAAGHLQSVMSWVVGTICNIVLTDASKRF